MLQVERAEEYLEEVWDDKCKPEILKNAASADITSRKMTVSVYDCQSLCPSLNKNPADLPETEDQEKAVSGINFADIEKISPLCKLKLLEDGGLNVEYRCVKCHDCPDCRNSGESERGGRRTDYQGECKA